MKDKYPHDVPVAHLTQTVRLTGLERDEVAALIAAATSTHPPLSEYKLTGLFGASDDRVHVLARRAPSKELVGYGQLARQGNRTNLEITAINDEVRAAVLETARVMAPDDAPLQYWLFDPTVEVLRATQSAGLVITRTLVAMTLSGAPLEAITSTLATTAFDFDRDSASWLTQNRRAFEGHLEQQGWTEETLRLRMREPWFDSNGFRLIHLDGQLAGSCLCKVTSHGETKHGEIYVIGVDPAFQGRGLGRELTSAGIVWMRENGVSVVSLYVDGNNTAARLLYGRLGFVVDHEDLALSEG